MVLPPGMFVAQAKAAKQKKLSGLEVGFDYFREDKSKNHWKPVPGNARVTFPAVDTIMLQRVVRAG